MSLWDFMQPYIQWLQQNPTKEGFPATLFYVAGNRNEKNPFVLFGTGYFNSLVLDKNQGAVAMTGLADFYFSDRIARGVQPFDATRRKEGMHTNLDLKAGVLQFVDKNGVTETQFSAFEERNSGLLLATSDFDRTIIVMNVRQGRIGNPSQPPSL